MRSENDANRGLYQKFEVRRTDGKSASGEKHEHCRYFVLDLDHDQFAKAAILAYADACASRFPVLARDLRNASGDEHTNAPLRMYIALLDEERAEIERLRAALEPFAAYAEIAGEDSDGILLTDSDRCQERAIRRRHFVAARAALIAAPEPPARTASTPATALVAELADSLPVDPKKGGTL